MAITTAPLLDEFTYIVFKDPGAPPTVPAQWRWRRNNGDITTLGQYVDPTKTDAVLGGNVLREVVLNQLQSGESIFIVDLTRDVASTANIDLGSDTTMALKIEGKKFIKIRGAGANAESDPPTANIWITGRMAGAAILQLKNGVAGFEISHLLLENTSTSGRGLE